ncbi:hypothetical protein FS842_000109 [Serendipita sp. 407]|nr:hypothetical protein FRC16_004409 [Serendipita sp. 398]KAG9058911.1 hypothetical protein FS842_000109 [Serendipita sp. 407]
MFSGLACFSPTVERETRELWKRYGGRIASSINELEGVQWFFAALGDCDWIRRLTEHGVTVHEQSWIVDSLKSGFTSLPSLYALHWQGGSIFLLALASVEHHLDRRGYRTLARPNQQSSESTSEDEIERTLVENATNSVFEDKKVPTHDPKAQPYSSSI